MKILNATHLFPVGDAPIKDGCVVIEDDKIVDIGPQEKIRQRYGQAQEEDFGLSVLMPGLVNAETQLDLLNFDGKGYAGESLEFLDWMVASWKYRKKITPADRRQSLESGVRQLLQSGTTCVGDSGQYVGVIPQAANSPLRMVLFPQLLTATDQTAMENYEGLLSQVDEIRENKSSRLTVGLAPFAPYTLSRHLLKIVSQEAFSNKIPLKIHASESFAEMQFFFESAGEIFEKIFPALGWSGERPPEHRKTPLQYLQSIGLMEGGPSLIGCNHLADGDLQILSRSGAKVIYSPRANSRLKLGSPPLMKLQKLKIPVALGTERNAALFSLSLWDEMRHILSQHPENDRPSASDLLTMSTLHGARALGLADKIGTLAPGKQADLIAVRLPKKVSLEKIPDLLVQNTTERDIAAVFVEGKRLHG